MPTAPLLGALGNAHEHAERLLDENGSPLEVVAWLSSHLAALDRAVYPSVRRSLPDGAALIARHRDLVTQITALLRVVERRHTGDVLASAVDPARLTDELKRLVARQHETEVAITERLVAVLDDQQQADLVRAYQDSVQHAPTRPHPHLTHAGWLTPLVFWLDRSRDRLLDTMDGRHVPMPQPPRRTKTSGRWGHYWLGQPQGEPTDRDDLTDRDHGD